MAINFNNLNNTAGLSKPTKANSLSTAQSSAQDSAKKAYLSKQINRATPVSQCSSAKMRANYKVYPRKLLACRA